MAKKNKKTVAVKSGKPALVQTVHGSKGIVCGKLAFKAQKAHRLIQAFNGHGITLVLKSLSDFARTGVVNPQSMYLVQAEPYNGNPMMALMVGPTDQTPFTFGKAKAGMMSEAFAAHSHHEIATALAEVTDGHPLRLSGDEQAQSPPAPVHTPGQFSAFGVASAPSPTPITMPTPATVTNTDRIAQLELELAQTMRNATRLQRELSQLRMQSNVA